MIDAADESRPRGAEACVASPPSAHDASVDARSLAFAQKLAERGRGRVEPNPVVGAVVVASGPEGGEVVGEGWHARYGGPHAEVAALAAAGARARGATVYVTLEPCNHFGK